VTELSDIRTKKSFVLAGINTILILEMHVNTYISMFIHTHSDTHTSTHLDVFSENSFTSKMDAEELGKAVVVMDSII
jgi:hypothetical protein